VFLRRSLDDTANALGIDADSYRHLLQPLLQHPDELMQDALAPLRIPRHPVTLARFGIKGLRSAQGVAGRFHGAPAKALLAGCAGHAILPLDRMFTGAVGLMFLIAGHLDDWPVAAGGSRSIALALASILQLLGGHIQTNALVRSADDLPPARLYLFDTDPKQVAQIARRALPDDYLRRLGKFRYGPGVFKLDWALDGSIPWRDPACRTASTVHLGGTFEEIAAAESAVWRGEHPAQPFVIACQQSEFDIGRAPLGKHTGWAYCHVPAYSQIDMTEAIEQQVERFAPGFKRLILGRHVTTPSDLQRGNPNYVGGAITGGVADVWQLFTRPVARLNPYSTPNPRVWLCSASTPPGGGVHGMCGYHAAQSALQVIERFEPAALR
jgi:phytoene dehydrogenase-like protein